MLPEIFFKESLNFSKPDIGSKTLGLYSRDIFYKRNSSRANSSNFETFILVQI